MHGVEDQRQHSFVIENDVIVGREGHLFLAQGGHDVLDVAVRNKDVKDDSFNHCAANLSRRATLARASGTKFLHVIYPDKQSVLSDFYVTPDPLRLGHDFIQKHSSLSEMILYPLETLRREAERSYMRCDTHLSDFGSIAVVAEIVEALTGDDQTETRKLLNAKLSVSRDHMGDLGSKLKPQRSHVELFLPVFWPTRWFHNDMTGGNNGLTDLRFSFEPIYDKRLLFFGDSFGREACKLLSFFFKEIVFARTPYFHDEIFHAIQPDYVVSENVERYLDSCSLDRHRPWYTLFPMLGPNEYAPPKTFTRAFSAVLCYPHPPYTDFPAALRDGR